MWGSVNAQTTLVQLHPDGVETNEPCIAIDPNYPGTQILGSNNNLFFISNDGGLSWTPKQLSPKEGFYGDPVVYINRWGTHYICHLAQNKTEKWPEQFDRIVFERSTDGGANFSSMGVGFTEGKVQDKPWIFVDEGKHSKFRDRVYLSWTEFDKYGSKNPLDSSRIRVSYSTDEGATFSEPVVISDTSGDASDDDKTLEGATLAAGKNGELYAVWAGNDFIWFDQSLDGGKTWGTDKKIATQVGGWNQQVAGLYRANSMPFVKCDNNGKIYVVYSDVRNGDHDVYYLFSKDKGVTWMGPIRVNNDPLKNGKDQYMPNIAVDRKKNKVYVLFYDRRNSENNKFTDVYACELKGMKPGINARITNESFCVPSSKIFFGDYISIAAAKNEVRMAFTTYEVEKQIPTVQVALLQGKQLQKWKSNEKPNYIQLVQDIDSNMVYLHFNVNGAKSCSVELTRGNQLYYKQLFDPLVTNENEVALPVSRFTSGVYRLTLSFKGHKVEKDVFIERR
jgi:hypothetical protein